MRLLALAALALLVIASPAPGRQETPAPGAPSPEEAYAPLRRELRTLVDSLRNLGGVSDDERAAVESLRDRTATLNEQWPEYAPGVAIELQLSMWLNDEERVEALFDRLRVMVPDRGEIQTAWLDHLRRTKGENAYETALSELRTENPDDVEIALRWAEYLHTENRFDEGIVVFESLDVDVEAHPRAALIESDCLFAEHRFDESIAALETIPQSARTADAVLGSEVLRALGARTESKDRWVQEEAIRSTEAEADDLPRAVIVTSKGPITLELFEDDAPNTVANFITLAESDYYDGTTFHRVETVFMAQGGDPNSREGAEGVPGTGGPGYKIADEHKGESYRRHFTGSLSMANSGPDTGGSQFFITVIPTPHLNGRHTVFGRVLEGIDVARSLRPDDPIESISILRKRDHVYEVVKIDEAAPGTQANPIPIDLSNIKPKP